MQGKIALVTGASRGIGEAIAVALAEQGATVVVNYRSRKAEAEQVVRKIQRFGQTGQSMQADVADSDQVNRMVTAIEQEHGPIDILVNNAGITRPQDLADITETDWDEIIDVNLKSMFLLTQAVLPAMRKQRWGRIINLSSVAAQVGGVVGPHYAASKAGTIGLTHAYAAMLAGQGITVNAIAPALIETEMVTSNPRAKADFIPVGRFGKIEEVADVALMLVKNGYITGQTINVNGGWYMSS